MMTCREFVDFLMSYLDDELEHERRRVFEGHMDACPSCHDYLTTYEDTIRLGKLACDDQGGPPEDVPEKLIEAILAARTSSS